MSYGLQGVYETASSNSTSKDMEYHQYLRHDGPSRTYSNDFHNSSMSNGHHRLDDIEDEQLEQEEEQQNEE